jgi:hypothetical protein
MQARPDFAFPFLSLMYMSIQPSFGGGRLLVYPFNPQPEHSFSSVTRLTACPKSITYKQLHIADITVEFFSLPAKYGNTLTTLIPL